MARKSLSFLEAVVVEDGVRLIAYKSPPAFLDRAGGNRFDTIRVYRRAEPDFAFGDDYSEYFDGLVPAESDVIFEGPVDPENGRKFVYDDFDVEPGSTYAYWMAAGKEPPTGPAPVKARDPLVWWSQHKIANALDVLKSNDPEWVHVETVGHTVRGAPIRAIRLGRARRCVAFLGAIHAGEAGPELILSAFEQILRESKLMLAEASIIAIPVVNVDERSRQTSGVPWYLRTNANGVDLNRNFPGQWERVDTSIGFCSSEPGALTYRGPGPSSEPETRAVMDYLRAHKVKAVFSMHGLSVICGSSLVAAPQASGESAASFRCIEFARAYCHGHGDSPGMAAKAPESEFLHFTSPPGSIPVWAWLELGIPAFDIEISAEERSTLAQCRVDRTDRFLLDEYRQRHVNGIRSALQCAASAR